MSSYARANVRITNEKKQKANSHEGITWSEMEKKMYKLKRSINGKQYLEYIEDVSKTNSGDLLTLI